LKSKGVYVIKLFEGLTDLEADEIEWFLIRASKAHSKLKFYLFLLLFFLDPDLAGNVSEGNLTARILELKQKSDDLDREMQQWFESAMQKIEVIGEDQLFTEERAKVSVLWISWFIIFGVLKKSN
jgi:hypothetical protein